MVVEDRATHPMSIEIVCELDGQADPAALRKALHGALRRHPLLAARLSGRGRRARWIAAACRVSIEEQYVGEGTPSAASVAPDDNRWGVRVRVTYGVSETTLRFEFAHAVVDGIGALQYIGDVLGLYGEETASPDMRPRFLPLDVEQLRRRRYFDIRIPHPVSPAVALKAMLTESWKVLTRRPSVLRATSDAVQSIPGNEQNVPRFTMAGDAWKRYADVASSSGVTVNDLLLRDVFLTMRNWNASLGNTRSAYWLRTTVPTSLRYRKALRMPAANVLGYAFLTHRSSECDDPATLLASIAGEMQAVTQWGLGSFFVKAVEYADRVPGLLWAGSRLSRRFSTLVFSNVGDTSRRFRVRFPSDRGHLVVGNLILRHAYGTPPVRPGTRIAMGTMSCGEHTSFAVRYDQRHFGRDTATAFLEMFREQLFGTSAAAREAGVSL
jgi:NRPS condensation-like uncharacterized protein